MQMQQHQGERGAAPQRRESRYGEGIRNARALQRAICVAVGPDEPDLDELRELLRTAGVAVAGELTQRRDKPHADSYVGTGKLSELKAEAERVDANVVACDDELTPRQERSIEEAVGLPVIDRTAIILDIFADHARSAEGKLQVELAQLEYNFARMRGLWTHLERLGGGIGTRGPGESQIETDRRLARARVTQVKRKLTELHAARAMQRRERDRAELPTVALTGYTNAGKSSLLNAITDADVRVRDRLFETLDTTSRGFEIAGWRILLTDTVGFIRKLPHQVVEAFAATLEEAYHADLLLHVCDASVDEELLATMIEAVEKVLDEIGAGGCESLLVLNKCDLIAPDRLTELRFRHPHAILVSAATHDGLDELRAGIGERLKAMLEPIDVMIPYASGALLNEVHRRGAALKREDTEQGVHVRALVPKTLARRLDGFRTPAIEHGV